MVNDHGRRNTGATAGSLNMEHRKKGATRNILSALGLKRNKSVSGSSVRSLPRTYSGHSLIQNWPMKRHSRRQHDPFDKLITMCKSFPTVREVSRFLEEHPDILARTTSDQGQTALHVAAHHGADPSVIMFLAQKYPEACSIADHKGRFPLHYVARWTEWHIPSMESDFGLFYEALGQDGDKNLADPKDKASPDCDPFYMDMLRIVSRAYPLAIQHEDDDGCNPIEFALLDGAPLPVVKLLQRASVRSWKTQQKEMGEMVQQRSKARPTSMLVARTQIDDTLRNSVVSRQA
jgi:hypothetical protein